MTIPPVATTYSNLLGIRCCSYPVTFTESGLPLGPGLCWPFWSCSTPQWTVGFDEVSQSSTGTSMSFYAQTEVRLVPKKKADF